MHAGDPISQKSTRTSLVMYAHHKVVTDMAQWDLDMRACMRDLTGAGSVGASNSGTSSALTDVASCNVMMHWTLRPQADAATATGAHDDDDGHDAVRPRRRASTPAQAAPAAGTSRRVATSVARDSSPLQRGGPSTSTSSLTSASLSDTSGVEPVQSAVECRWQPLSSPRATHQSRTGARHALTKPRGRQTLCDTSGHTLVNVRINKLFIR